jgi:prolyl-tRNA synthetase
MPKDEQKQEDVGITVKKDEDMSEWYTQVVIKSELADYSSVSGCIIFRPNSYEIWENITKAFDAKIKKTGHRNCYFPLFIPESLLIKESKHVEGFTPEVAWVTHAGNTPLNEKLAIRPTSETIMYASYSQWIRSWRDLPLLLNQWNSVVRWEFKHAKPFLRTREFLWQEGHTAHATKEGADEEVMQQLFEYVDLIENHMAIALLSGKKTDREKFAGADYTTTIEAVMPDGKALQMGTSHQLGQNFSKAFDIKFVDQDEQTKYVWQTSWGLSTRTIGAMVLMHGDDKGLVLPPKLAPTQVILVPIIFKDTKNAVFKKTEEVCLALRNIGIRAEMDLREEYSAGWKFNQWELRGIPLRIEIGPRDMKNNACVVVKRNTGEKKTLPLEGISGIASELLEKIQDEMLHRSKAILKGSIVPVKDMAGLKQAVNDKKLAKAQFCCEVECEDALKTEADGATSRCLPFTEQKNIAGNCVRCGKESKGVAVFGKAY